MVGFFFFFSLSRDPRRGRISGGKLGKLTMGPCSALAHHLEPAARRRPEQGGAADFHTRAAEHAGADNKVCCGPFTARPGRPRAVDPEMES